MYENDMLSRNLYQFIGENVQLKDWLLPGKSTNGNIVINRNKTIVKETSTFTAIIN